MDIRGGNIRYCMPPLQGPSPPTFGEPGEAGISTVRPCPVGHCAVGSGPLALLVLKHPNPGKKNQISQPDPFQHLVQQLSAFGSAKKLSCPPSWPTPPPLTGREAAHCVTTAPTVDVAVAVVVVVVVSVWVRESVVVSVVTIVDVSVD